MLESSMLLNIQQPFPKLENTILIPASPDKVQTHTDKTPSALCPRSTCLPESSCVDRVGPLSVNGSRLV